jgi:protein disulfide-isomerase A1
MKEAVVLLVSKTASNFQSIISQYKEAASKFKGKVIFVLLNADDIKLNSKVEILMELAGLNKQHQGPIVRLIDFNKSEQLARYKPYSDQITAASLTQFVQDYLDKKISPFRLVQEIPPGWDAKPVKILTVKNFDQVAKDKTKNVLVKFCNLFLIV